MVAELYGLEPHVRFAEVSTVVDNRVGIAWRWEYGGNADFRRSG